jgi:hypothetical protein
LAGRLLVYYLSFVVLCSHLFVDPQFLPDVGWNGDFALFGARALAKVLERKRDIAEITEHWGKLFY